MKDSYSELSIRDFAQIVGIKQSVLRYYDEIGLLRPSGRGENNYRYYTFDQIQMAKLIETLKGLKIPLKEIVEMMETRDSDRLIRLLTDFNDRISKELKDIQTAFSMSNQLRNMTLDYLPLNDDEIKLASREGKQLWMGPLNVFEPGEDYHRAFAAFYRLAVQKKWNIAYPIGGYFDTFEEFKASPSLPKRYFLLDPDGSDKSISGNYLVAYRRGGYGDMGDLAEQIDAFVKERGIEMVGPVYQVYPINELHTKDPSNYLLRTSILLA